jgi:DNA polymerase
VNKGKQLAILRDDWLECGRCGLCERRKHVVFGEGNPSAKILIVGEAPGPEEDKSGRPFMGETGKILDTFLRAARLDRREDVYITNVVGCRPTVSNLNDATGESVVENRTPSTEERNACKQRVLDTIYAVDPLLIVGLGKTALQTLLGKTNVIAKMRGNVYTMHMPGKRVADLRYPVLAMFHPSFLARNFEYTNPEGVWYQTGRDFKLLTEVIDYIDLKYYGIARRRYDQPEEQNPDTED